MILRNRNIVLGVGGGIAAYKAVELARRLADAGAAVRVVMTPSAAQFVTPLTFQAATGNRVGTALLDAEAEAAMGHIELARWADVVLIAPATANLIARLAHGFADDLLTTLCLATNAPLIVAPAMNQAMWAHPSVQANLDLLASRGVRSVGPAEGVQACGDVGPGRMLEPDEIVTALGEQSATSDGPSLGECRVLLTAGPTVEDIDPVRFIANRSSGKMGYALANAFARRGARVTLVSGPVKLAPPPGTDVIEVRSAEQMYNAVMERIDNNDIFVATAAVADFRPAHAADQKIKKGDSKAMTLELIRNPDILAAVGTREPRPFTVGFAAETEKLAEHARRKLIKKGADLIIANDVSGTDCGFESDLNEVVVIGPEDARPLPKATKADLAKELVELIAKAWMRRR